MSTYKAACMPGDGIGSEIITEGRKVLDAAGEKFGFDIDWTEYDTGAEKYLKTGELISEDELKELKKFPAIYFGAIGDPRVKTGILEKGILLTMRFYFDQYINLRPIKLLHGVETPLANKKPEDIDFVVVRENTEDFYVGIGSRVKAGKQHDSLEVIRDLYSVKFGIDVDSDADELAYQIGVVSRQGSKRVMEYAFRMAESRKKKLTSVDKANVLTDVYGLWRDVFEETKKGFPDVTTEYNFVDAVTMWFVKNPEWFDVVVTPNMFGDIITDLGAMIQGGLGLAPGGNINPKGTSMFEPIHGSAPKYKGMNVANPLATIWAGSLMLDTLGEKEAAASVVRSIEHSILAKAVTKDMGGSMRTSDIGDWIAKDVLRG
ncbi:MAG: isocitrate/isopropylmalate family dehydrogenase [Methanocorpusculum sp.]|nr:isocitrate/isopropylmalate family dehydrogenase [Methanocorpusculum sp.]MDD2470314.1 isocitrate/isopropylmalate family dehydrogenase [Methanocorpusculum sp.]MDD3257586.1 isocitrate/isopropylmalate family dehydrogenase [Methanocorpusculum sp.]MDD4132429.1 isocitrate/isopropylmalate family dehydrogenase [Methanocorpusculum sp.]